MLNCKKEFIAGLLMATISVSAATKLTSLYAVEKKYSSEVEFSQSIGLFDSERLSNKTLRSNIAEIAFYRGLNLILVNKGIVDSFNTNKLEALGITQTQSPMNSLTRKKAAETILRAMMLAQKNGQITVPENIKKRHFRDFTPEEQYKNIMSYAIEKGVLKSVNRNNFRPNKKITVKEALGLLKNLYELDIKPTTSEKVEITKPAKQEVVKPTVKTIYVEPNLSKFFNDIDSSNPMADTIKKLINAGAFDYTNLNHELNLPKSIKTNDFVLMCKGMLTKAGKTDLIDAVTAIGDTANPNEAITRNTVAQIGSVMSDAYPHKDYNIKVSYVDVPANSAIDVALKKISKAGIKMGYSDGKCKGKERVSRYEAFSLLGIIVGDNVGTKIKVEKVENAPASTTTSKPVVKENNVAKPQTTKTPSKTNVTSTKQQTTESTKASKLEQQLKDKYDGLTFQQRIELRKSQFHKILNRESTK